MAFLSIEELQSFNFKYVGKSVKVSDKASIYNASNIYLDDYCRIDDFCILSAGQCGIHIGKFVHIAAYSSLIGSEFIYLSDFSGLSSRVSIYSSNDDYSGQFMAHPTIPHEFRNVENRPVYLDKHVLIGSGTVILPGAKLNMGVAVGALSLIVGHEYDAFTIFAGIPAKKIKIRHQKLLTLEEHIKKRFYNFERIHS